jgi:ABC-type uncharacterized transport system involved in gliding motility auxiliary subunit
MNTVVKDFWKALILAVVIFIAALVLGLILKPVYIALILFTIIIVIKFKSIWAGLKYYWNLILKNEK